jgi:putative flippase GtrA
MNNNSTFSLSLILRYIFVGGFVGIIYYAVMWSLLNSYLKSLGLSAMVAFITTSPLSYVLHRIITFRKTENIFQIARFSMSALLLFFLSYSLDHMFGAELSQNLLIISTWITSSIINFVVYKTFVFRSPIK